jgi:hypothetical protein
MNVYDRLTKAGKAIVDNAYKEAAGFDHPYLGTEHLLLGLLRQKEEPVARILNQLGLTHSRAREMVETIVGYEKSKQPKDIEITGSAILALEYAYEEATAHNANQAGPEHILVGLLRLGTGVAIAIFEKINLPLDLLDQQLGKLLGVDVKMSGTTGHYFLAARLAERGSRGNNAAGAKGPAGKGPSRHPTPDYRVPSIPSTRYRALGLRALIGGIGLVGAGLLLDGQLSALAQLLGILIALAGLLLVLEHRP